MNRLDMPWQASVLRSVADFERASKTREPAISSLLFAEDIAYAAFDGAGSVTLDGTVTATRLESLRAAAGPAAETPATPTSPGADLATRWEQWHEVLAELSGYPTYVEHAYARLAPNAIQLFSHGVVFSFRNLGRIMQYEYTFDARHEFPLGLLDEVRLSFLTGVVSGQYT